MKFNTDVERMEAIKAQADKLGEAYGQLKFEEALFKETLQSYVDGKPGAGTVTVADEEKATKPAAKKASKPRKKKEENPVEAESTEQAVEEEQAPETDSPAAEPEAQPETQESTEQSAEPVEEAAPEGDCPITDVASLRSLLATRYRELKGNPTNGVKQKLTAAMEEATGFSKADEVPADKYPAAYAAITSTVV